MGRSVSGWVTEQIHRQAGRLRLGWCLEEVTDRITGGWAINTEGNPRLQLEWGRRHRPVASLWIRPDFGPDDHRPSREAMKVGPHPDHSIRWPVTWATWDRRGTGGENSSEPDLCSALEVALVRLLAQSIIPDVRAGEVQALLVAAQELSAGWRALHGLRGIRWAYSG